MTQLLAPLARIPYFFFILEGFKISYTHKHLPYFARLSGVVEFETEGKEMRGKEYPYTALVLRNMQKYERRQRLRNFCNGSPYTALNTCFNLSNGSTH